MYLFFVWCWSNKLDRQIDVCLFALKACFACIIISIVPSHCQDGDPQGVCPCTDTGLYAEKKEKRTM